MKLFSIGTGLLVGLGVFVAGALGACGSKDTGVPAPTCQATLSDCSGTCVDSRIDPKNCGACGKACAAGEVCSAGACSLECVGGTAKCGTSCVNTKSDPLNCGKCGTKCDAGTACADGTCSTVCPTDTKKCGKSCVDTTLSPLHCGDCDKPCDAGKVCSMGKCDVSCLGGTTKCGDICVNTKSDAGFCGDCMTACKATEVCSAGKCTAPCGAGETLCSGSGCTDLGSNPKACGMCGKACQATEICSKGACITAPLYALVGRGFTFGDLYTVDPSNGKGTSVVKLPAPFIGATFKNGLLYGASPSLGEIFRIDVATGGLKYVGLVGTTPRSLGLRADGLLIACENNAEFITVDTATNVLTKSGKSGCNGPISFNTNDKGVMYVLRANQLFTMDANFVQTLVKPLSKTGKYKGATFHLGTLYAVDLTTANLVKIDIASGVVTNLGKLPDNVEALASNTP